MSLLSHHFFLSLSPVLHHQKESFSRITLQKSSFLSSFFPMKSLLSLLSSSYSSLFLLPSFSLIIGSLLSTSLHSNRYPLIKYREIASTKPSSLSLSFLCLIIFHSFPISWPFSNGWDSVSLWMRVKDGGKERERKEVNMREKEDHFQSDDEVKWEEVLGKNSLKSRSRDKSWGGSSTKASLT